MAEKVPVLVTLYKSDGTSFDETKPFLVASHWDIVDDKPDNFPPTVHPHDAGDIDTGTLHVDRIPSIPYSKISNPPTIPTAITEATVTGWGFTKNTGTVTGSGYEGRLAYWTGANSIEALETSYPSLTELKHVKGVTSSIQTQLSGKAASAHSHTFASLTSKPTDLAGYGIANAYTKTEVDAIVATVYRHAGSALTYAALASVATNPKVGDVWNIEDTGMNYVWNGAVWDPLGSFVDLTPYVKTVKVGTTSYNSSGGTVSLPAYPTTLPASDVSEWAKKPSLSIDDVPTIPYSKLSGAPTTLRNPYSLTIQRNGVTLDTYNGSAAKTINIIDNDLNTTYTFEMGTVNGTFKVTPSGGSAQVVGVYSHPTGAGNNHVPANGASDGEKFLKATSTPGDYVWDTVVQNATHTGEVFGSGALTIAANAVTNAKLADMATARIKGRVTAGPGDPEDLTVAQVQGLIGLETTLTTSSDVKVPSSKAVANYVTGLGYTSNQGTITGVTAGTGLSGGGTSGGISLALDFSELTNMTGDISGTTQFILQNGTTESRKAVNQIKLSNFVNDMGWTSNTGTVTGEGTAGRLAVWTGTNSIEALGTAYPSLNELSYVKGVTSPIQTQLSDKADSLHTHGSYNRSSTTLSGASVFSNIVVTNGIVTSISTRNLTAANVNAVSTTGTAYNSTRWGSKQLRVGEFTSGLSGYITLGY